MTGRATSSDGADTPLPRSQLTQLVSRYGLRRAGARPELAQYTRDLWERREFVTAFATARGEVGYSGSFLGQAWQLLTPILNAAVYYLIFGLLLHTSRGIPNFIAYLVIGVFVFDFLQGSVLQGSRSIAANLGLTRALHFPRAVLPVASTLEALRRFSYSFPVLILVAIFTGEPIRLKWVLVVPGVLLITMFNMGLAFIVARIGAKVPDITQILPFIMRTWLYMSGVFYSASVYAGHFGGWVTVLLGVNPAAVFINLIRGPILAGTPVPLTQWMLGVGWAVVTLVVGYAYFWKEEESYGSV